MSTIAQVFADLKAQGRKGLVPFITAGDPDPSQTLDLMHALVRGGADVIELGVPFSDPMADGPVIQRASERALAHGMTLKHCIALVKEFRQTNAKTPIVLMGYANPIEHMGTETFVKTAKEAGVDGVLVVDYPPEECEDFAQQCKVAGIDPIFLLAPTSSQERINQVGQVAAGYIYYVSLKGVTGAANLDTQAVAGIIPQIRAVSTVPIAVGFGIRDAQSAVAIGKTADAVVIGSRIVQLLEETPAAQRVQSLETFLKEIREALDQSK
jgi:tryptophan synthase alpha chain